MMSTYGIRKFSRLGIVKSTYVQRFPRIPHFVDHLKDMDQPYFNERDRLTASELSEVGDWPSTVRELFVGEEGRKEKKHFLHCLCGEVEPVTSTERIVVKLIHQALALGGLHCQIDVGSYVGSDGYPEVPRNFPANDIVDLKAVPLRSFLLGVQRELAEYIENGWKVNLSAMKQNIEDTFDPHDLGARPDPIWIWSDSEQLIRSEPAYLSEDDIDEMIGPSDPRLNEKIRRREGD